MQVGSMIVGLPTVTLQFPRTLAAWLRLRMFTQTSFEFPDMIRVEAGFMAILFLVVMLQLLLFLFVHGEAWAAAFVLSFYYFLCLIYGFGTLVVAFNTSREFEGHTQALDQLRINYTTNCYLAWGPHHGNNDKRLLAKDVCLQTKEVCRALRMHAGYVAMHSWLPGGPYNCSCT